jgi:hypothetical protein
VRHANALLQQAKADLAAPDTPLGHAQADAVRASTEGPQDGSAYRAVAAAKQFKGSMVTMTYESGLQALEPRNFSGPLWQDLTGISSTVVELATRSVFRFFRAHCSPAHMTSSDRTLMDPVAGRWRRDRADRRLRDQIHEQG